MPMPGIRPALPGVSIALTLVLLLGALGSCSTAREGLAAERRGARRCRESIPDLFDRVSASVVFINATSINPYQLTDRVERVVGSGVIIDPAGLVLTNSHVAFNRQSIVVTLDDGTSLPGQLVGADPIFDLAVLRVPVPPGRKLPVAVPGDSDRLRVGDEVLAIGNPLGLDQTLTRGVVSAMNRILPETPFSLDEPLIQTDAAINPGNSGGPLLDRCGEVVGITTAIIPDAENIGFAIPINLAKVVLPQLLKEGHVVRPWIGFHGQIVPEGLDALLKIPLVQGFMVEVIEPGSPAEKAGLRGGGLEVVIAGREFLFGGDIVTRLNGAPLDTPERLEGATRALKVGDTLKLTLFRDGAYRDVEYVLPERPLLPGDLRDQRQALPATGGARHGAPPAGAPGDPGRTPR